MEKIEGYEHIPIDDDDYVEWVPLLEEYNDSGHQKITQIKYHKCTEKDWKEFHPIVKGQTNTLKAKKAANQFYCLANEDIWGNAVDFDIYGNWANSLVRAISIIYRPCVPRQETEFNRDTEKCLVQDPKDPAEMDKMFQRSQEYVG